MKTVPLFVVILLALTFTSCQKNKPVELNSQVENQTDISTNTTNLQMLTSCYGMSNIGFSGEGAYEWDTRAKNGSNITYIDFKSLSKMFLCNDINCSHDGESCSSWFDGSSGSVFLSSNNEKIYLVKGAIGDKEPVEKLIHIEKNGSQRTLICELQAGERFLDAVVEKDNMLLMSVMQTDGQKKLCEIDTTTGELNKLIDLEQSEWVNGSYNDRLILLKLELNGSSSGKFSYSKLDLTTMEKVVFYEYSYNDSGDLSAGKVVYYNNGFLYVITPTGNQLSTVSKINIEDGVETQITSELPYFHVDTTTIVGIFDDKLLVIATDNNNPELIQKHLFAISCSSGEVTELHHNYRFGELTIPSEILAVTSEKYFIASDFVSASIALYGNDGVPYTSEILTPTYRFVSKDDYWNNIQQYELINDLTVR